MKKLINLFIISFVSLSLSTGAFAKGSDLKIAEKAEKQVLKNLKKTIKKLGKELSKEESKALKRSFKAFKKEESENDLFLSNENEALLVFTLISSPEQSEIIINGLCADDETLYICYLDSISSPELDALRGLDRSNIQNDIGAALNDAANLNDEQKEDLRKTLFIFEEFYKSGSAILAKITQLIERMASNIAGR